MTTGDRTELEECLAIGDRLTGPTGLIASIAESCRRPDMIDIITYLATPNTGGDGDSIAVHLGGTGCGLTWQEACAAAIGELIERVSLAFDEGRVAAECPPAELSSAGGVRFLDPTVTPLFAPEHHARGDFPYRPFTSSEPIPWVEGWHLGERTPALIPAEMAYLATNGRPHAHLYATSSGVASGLDVIRATCSALYELIERDAVMIAWYARRAAPRLDPHSFADSRLAELCRRCDRAGLRVHLLDVTTDIGLPVVLAALESRRTGRGPALALGAACRSTRRAAARKALNEAMHTWNWAYELLLERPPLEPGDPGQRALTDFADHVHLYAHRAMAERASFLWSGPEAPPEAEPAPSAPQEELAIVLAGIERTGHEAFVVDLTSPDLPEDGCRVVRALVPGLVPLSVGTRAVYQGSPRLYRVPRLLGDRGAPRTLAELNPDPHPFP